MLSFFQVSSAKPLQITPVRNDSSSSTTSSRPMRPPRPSPSPTIPHFDFDFDFPITPSSSASSSSASPLFPNTKDSIDTLPLLISHGTLSPEQISRMEDHFQILVSGTAFDDSEFEPESNAVNSSSTSRTRVSDRPLLMRTVAPMLKTVKKGEEECMAGSLRRPRGPRAKRGKFCEEVCASPVELVY